MRTSLKLYAAEDLSDNNLLIVETNISSYNIVSNNKLLLSIKYSLLLYYIYFLIKNINTFSESFSKSVKYSKNNLISFWKNKKTNKAAIFSNKN